jgi:O-succinylbenzoate synthase
MTEPVRIRRARLDELELRLVEPFETSFGVERRRRFLLLTLESEDGTEGVAECVAAREPDYSSEATDTARWMIGRLLLPELFREPVAGPADFATRARRWRGHPMAKAAVEMALWDLFARRENVSLARSLGSRRRRVEVGVSVGIQKDIPSLVRRVGRYLEDGYRRIKVKVKPGWDDAALGALRDAYSDLRMWADANQAYSPDAVSEVRRWATRHRVEQVEQPFRERALDAHARLVRGARFLVCLDESVVDEESLDDALERRAATSLNIKPGRVGGLGTSLALAARARSARVRAWVGGMLESGIGRAHNVAFASREEIDLPSDLSASDRYYSEDLIEPPFELGPGSTLAVPAGPGIGVRPVESRLARARRRSRVYTA